MSAPAELREIFAQWQEWSLKEGEAIAATNWSQVTECQNAKEKLQRLIIRIENQTKSALSIEERSLFHRTVANLLELERQNLEKLAEVRQKAELERDTLEVQSRTLKRVQRSYSFPIQSHWKSYS